LTYRSEHYNHPKKGSEGKNHQDGRVQCSLTKEDFKKFAHLLKKTGGNNGCEERRAAMSKNGDLANPHLVAATFYRTAVAVKKEKETSTQGTEVKRGEEKRLRRTNLALTRRG